mmetsp:Transcript_15980/g.18062  ORF Transcript_15980/g.18062 Transcript_15980/m.18062 type:complete len:408 (-) Transcript_15980:1368-2591(-)
MTDVLQRLVQTSARIANINFGKENKRPNAVKIRQLETNEESLLFSKKKESEIIRTIRRNVVTTNDVPFDDQVIKTKALFDAFETLSSLHDESIQPSDPITMIFEGKSGTYQEKMTELKSECQRLRARHAGLVARAQEKVDEENEPASEKDKEDCIQELEVSQKVEELQQIEQELKKLTSEIMQTQERIDKAEVQIRSSANLENDVERVEGEISDLTSLLLAQERENSDANFQTNKQENIVEVESDPEVKKLEAELQFYKEKCTEFEDRANSFENEKGNVLSTSTRDQEEMRILADEISLMQSLHLELEAKIKNKGENASDILKKIRGLVDSSLESACENSQSWGLARALKLLQENEGEMLLNEFKAELKTIFDGDSGRVLQVLYSLSGCNVINIDRKIPNRVMSLYI